MPYTDKAKTVEWETPIALFVDLDREFHFTLDPCATRENHKCPEFFTKGDNGLIWPWQGHRVFMNPPYGRAENEWIKKAYEEAQGDCVVVALLPVRTSTKRWWKYIHSKAEVRFLEGRLRFGEAKTTAPFDSCIVIWK